jgi:hypothetical protein
LRDYIPRIHEAGAELVTLGNGTPEQAKWFVGARRMGFPDPRTMMAGVSAFAKGFRQTGVKGSATQLGGMFVITADGRMAYSYLSRYAGDHPDPENAVAVLEREAKQPAEA